MAKKMTDMDGLLENWMESQHKLWDGWMQTVQQVSGGNPMAETWQQGLARWREAVDQTLETQKQATRAWAEQVSGVEGAPEELKRWAQEGVTLVDQWSDAQHGLWKQWFDLMSSAAPAGGAAPAAEQMRELMAGWEQASERGVFLRGVLAGQEIVRAGVSPSAGRRRVTRDRLSRGPVRPPRA
jgi:hypothetical protein